MSTTRTAVSSRAQAEPALAVLAGLVVFHAAVQAIAVGVSLFGVSLNSPVAEAIVVMSVGAGCLAWRCSRRRHVEAAERTAPAEPRRALTLPKAVLLLAGVTYVTAWVVCWFRPDTSCDGNLYHIPTMHFWAREGCVHWIDWPSGCGPFMNGYPSGVELTGLMMAMALHTSNFTNAVNLAFLPLGVLASAYLARAVGASTMWSAVAGAAWVLIPMNVAQATTTYVDSAYASCVAALLALAFYTVSCVAEDGELFPWRAVWPLGAAAGLAAAAKGTGAAAAPIALAVVSAGLLVGIVRHGRGRRGRLVLIANGFVISAAAVAVLVGGYWYIRNYVIGGSPLYPVGLAVAGYEVFPGSTLEEAVGITGSTAPALRALPAYQRALIHWAQMGIPPHTVWGCWPNIIWLGEGALGYLWLLGCVPAILWMLATKAFSTRHGGLPLVALGLIVAAAFVIQPMNWSARYTLWIYTVGLPCFALIASRVRQSGTRKARAARLWLSICLLMLMFEGAFTVTRIVPLALRPSNTIACLERHYWGRPVCYLMPQLSGSVFDDIFAGRAAVAMGPMSGHTHDGAHFKIAILGQLSLPLGSREILSIDEPVDEPAVARLVERGVQYVILDGDRPLPEVFQRDGFTVDHTPDFLVVTLER